VPRAKHKSVVVFVQARSNLDADKRQLARGKRLSFFGAVGRFFPSRRRDEKKSREAFFFFRRLFFSRSRRAIRRANVARSFVSPRRLNLLTFHASSKKIILESRRGGASDPHAAVAHGEETPQREGPHGRGRV
jgi:hypothetical protein